MLDLTIDTVSKGSVVFKVFSKKILEFNQCHWGLSLRTTFILMLTLYDQSAKKQGGKRDAIDHVGSGSIKIILTLLAKPVIIYV